MSTSEEFLILRCNIYENKTGVCLLEKIWHWPIQASPHDISKMLMTFNQMSNELGNKTKDVREVIFNATTNMNVSKNIGRRRKRLMMTQEKSKHPFQKIRLVYAQNDHVSIGLFHSFTRDERIIANISDFLNDLMEEFTSRGYIEKVIANKDVFADIAADKPNLKMDRDDVFNIFESFEPIVEVLRVKHQVDVMET